jgi:hypothetical protein
MKEDTGIISKVEEKIEEVWKAFCGTYTLDFKEVKP